MLIGFHFFSPIIYEKIKPIKDTPFRDLNEDKNHCEQLTVFRDKDKVYVLIKR